MHVERRRCFFSNGMAGDLHRPPSLPFSAKATQDRLRAMEDRQSFEKRRDFPEGDYRTNLVLMRSFGILLAEGQLVAEGVCEGHADAAPEGFFHGWAIETVAFAEKFCVP